MCSNPTRSQECLWNQPCRGCRGAERQGALFKPSFRPDEALSVNQDQCGLPVEKSGEPEWWHAEDERLRSEEEYQLRARAPLTDETLDFSPAQWDSIFGFQEEDGVPVRKDSSMTEVRVSLPRCLEPLHSKTFLSYFAWLPCQTARNYAWQRWVALHMPLPEPAVSRP